MVNLAQNISGTSQNHGNNYSNLQRNDGRSEGRGTLQGKNESISPLLDRSNSVFQSYRLVSAISGSRSVVIYQAINLKTRNDVCLKIFYFNKSNYEEVHRRFIREILPMIPLSSFSSEISPSLLNFGEDESEGCFYMETSYVEQVHLEQLQEIDFDLRLSIVLKVFLKLVNNLRIFHSYGFLHGDIKPANILIDSKLNPLLIDFGASINVNNRGAFDTGTFDYLPIETLDGGMYNHISEIYCVAVSLFEFLFCKLPFDKCSVALAIRSKVLGEFDQIDTGEEERDQALNTFFRIALSPKPSGRFRDLYSFEMAIRSLLDGNFNYLLGISNISPIFTNISFKSRLVEGNIFGFNLKKPSWWSGIYFWIKDKIFIK